MAGILMTAGPVSTHNAFKGLSRVFNMAITKAKYVAACDKLVAANLGTLVVLENISQQSHVFVKKLPSEARGILEKDGYSLYMCTAEDYEQRFSMPSSLKITPRIKKTLVELGMVSEHLFAPVPDTGGFVATAGNVKTISFSTTGDVKTESF